jgi:hypothetical protein
VFRNAPSSTSLSAVLEIQGEVVGVSDDGAVSIRIGPSSSDKVTVGKVVHVVVPANLEVAWVGSSRIEPGTSIWTRVAATEGDSQSFAAVEVSVSNARLAPFTR